MVGELGRGISEEEMIRAWAAADHTFRETSVLQHQRQVDAVAGVITRWVEQLAPAAQLEPDALAAMAEDCVAATEAGF